MEMDGQHTEHQRMAYIDSTQQNIAQEHDMSTMQDGVLHLPCASTDQNAADSYNFLHATTSFPFWYIHHHSRLTCREDFALR
jgi:hypothetical protein